ncbi:MAG: hypothetical protein ACJ8FY_23290 [Gemmataceae bacterium]
MSVGYRIEFGWEDDDTRDYFDTEAISHLPYYYGQKKLLPRPKSNEIEAVHELQLIKRQSTFSTLVPDGPGAGHIIHRLLKSKAEKKRLGLGIQVYRYTKSSPDGTDVFDDTFWATFVNIVPGPDDSSVFNFEVKSDPMEEPREDE